MLCIPLFLFFSPLLALSRCGKSVYFAERQTYDGKTYHGACLQIAKKKIAESKFMGYYPGAEDRLACQLGNESPARSQPAPRAAAQVPHTNSGANFCANCGAKRTGGNFCANCGTKF